MKTLVIALLGLALAGSAGWYGWRLMNTEEAERQAAAANLSGMHTVTAWPEQRMDGHGDANAERLLGAMGGVKADVTTVWIGDTTGTGQLHYTVNLAPLRNNAPRVAALASSCDWTLQLSDYQGESLAQIPLVLTPATGLARSVISLGADDQQGMNAADYASLTGLGPARLTGQIAVTTSCR